jgi:hypothetical protein
MAVIGACVPDIVAKYPSKPTRLAEPQINRNYYAKLPSAGVLGPKSNGEDTITSKE